MQSYNKLDCQIHALSQVIAKFNRTFVPPKKDDSHTNFYFDPLSHRLYGHWIQLDRSTLIFSLNLREFKFQFINQTREIVAEITINGKTITELEKETSDCLLKFGLRDDGFRNKMHYDIPDYHFIEDPFSKWDKQDINTWEYIRGLANEACFLTMGYMMSVNDIRIWPHHFDTGIYIKANSNRGLGFGLAMKDSMVNDAYFYYSVYALKQQDIKFKNLPRLTWGEWKMFDNWKGAVLPVTDLDSSPRKKIKQFIVSVGKQLLS